MPERLQKVLARAGHGSRREIERWIREGRLSVNGRTAELGVSVEPGDRIRLDGKPLATTTADKVPPRTLLYHKPAGELTTRRDEAGRPTVFERLPRLRHGRWISVGRLDFNTAGLLLVTTDGELAHRLMHPSWEVEREYAVRVLGEVDEATLQRLQTGVMLEDGRASFDQILDAGGAGANHWYHVTLREGKNREVRRLWESQDLTVSRLIRIRYGPVELTRDVRAGRFRDLTAEETATLYSLVKLDPPKPPVTKRKAPPRRGRRRR